MAASHLRLLPPVVSGDISATLDGWHAVDPAERIVVVGAGRGTGPWVQAARRWATPDVWLIEAGDDSYPPLQRLCADWPGSRAIHAVLADAVGHRPFHTASLMPESGLRAPESLRALYPHLTCKQVDQRPTTTLDTLLAEAPTALAWLIVDCTCASAVLDGARAVLDQFDLVVLRRYAHPAGLGQSESDALVWDRVLDRTGFVQRTVVASLHPGIEHVVHVRDHRRQIVAVRQALEQARQDAQRALSELGVAGRTHSSAVQAMQARHDTVLAELQARLTEQTQRTAAECQRATGAEAAAAAEALRVLAEARAHDATRLEVERLLRKVAESEQALADHQTQASQRADTLQAELLVAAAAAAETHAAMAQQAEAAVAARQREADLRCQIEHHELAGQGLAAQLDAMSAQAAGQRELAGTATAKAEGLESELVTLRQSRIDLERGQDELLAQLESASVELQARPARWITPDDTGSRPLEAISPSKPAFFSFWGGGPLSPFEWLCLKSFADHGYEVRLYSYDLDLAVPQFIQLADARDIAEESVLGRIRYESGSIYSPFSNYFRYLGIQKTGLVWIDTDNLCLSPNIRFKNGYILCGEDAQWISAGAIGLPQDSACLAALIERCEASIDVAGLPWGSLGPKLLTPMLGKDPHHEVLERFHFYPVHWRKTAQLLLPSDRDAVLRDCCGSWSVHLWNEVITRSGYHKRLCPPVGSFLHEKVVEHGVLDRFVDVLPEETMVRHASKFR
jgi:hypothetical protein